MSSANHLNTHLASPSTPLYLRVVLPADAPLHAAMLSRPENGAAPGSSPPLTADVSLGIITAQRESAAVPTVCGADGKVVSGPRRVNMMVCLSQRGAPPQGEKGGKQETVIGLGGFGAIKDWERGGVKIRAGDVGVLLEPEYRGKGYGVEAMKLAMDWAFSPVAQGGPQLDLVTVTTSEDNEAMIKLTEEKLGFKDGILRPAEFDKDKQEKYWEITAKQWHNRVI